MTAVHQFVPTLAPRDAVGGHYLAVQETLRGAGYRSDIYAYEAKEEYKRLARPFLSMLSMEQTLKLLLRGWVPCGAAFGVAAIH